jgi:hypothetical protein
VRQGLPENVVLLAGGEGAPGDLPGVEPITDFADLAARLRRAGAHEG